MKENLLLWSHYFTRKYIYGSFKIEAIMNWSTPINVMYVGYFMGLVGYYQWFIKGFFNISHPINSMKRKEIQFIWSHKCEKSSQLLKNLLISSTILNILYLKNDFVLCTYVGIKGFVGPLMKENHVVCFE